VWGLIIGKVVADIGFYVCTILSYEKFRSLVAIRHGERKEQKDASVDALPAS
jgi:hypothetical protein